jgi:5-methylcytosine-specific restriction protein A
MLRVIETKSEMDKVQRLFMNKLCKQEDKNGIISVGYKGESHRLKASWNRSLNIWWISDTSGNRYWNAFGITEPKWNTGSSHNIVCEINPPFQGINRRIARAFAKDFNGKLYLMHRGIIGGGRKMLERNYFRTSSMEIGKLLKMEAS